MVPKVAGKRTSVSRSMVVITHVFLMLSVKKKMALNSIWELWTQVWSSRLVITSSTKTKRMQETIQMSRQVT